MTTDGAACLCRQCGARCAPAAERCSECGGPRLIAHPELLDLSIAHIDCDAFYASVEKCDDPSLRDRPVIVGGRRRGVVAACCYIARMSGVHSAMPMFKALRACPDAVVIPPNMEKYKRVGDRIRNMMRAATPAVEPLSIDEAFLDLAGTERVHAMRPAEILIRLVRDIENKTGVTASVGLSYNKSLAKIASDLDKPRGFATIGKGDSEAFLADKPVGMIWGVGAALQSRLLADGYRVIGDLRRADESTLARKYGAIGVRLFRFSRGQDDRKVTPNAPTKSISTETTFDKDLSALEALRHRIWPLCESVSARLKRSDLAGKVVTLKIKSADFRILTRNQTLPYATQRADAIYRSALPMLEKVLEAEAAKRGFPEVWRLIGVGVSSLVGADEADPPDLLDPDADRRRKVEKTLDTIRNRMGQDAIALGRGLRD